MEDITTLTAGQMLTRDEWHIYYNNSKTQKLLTTLKAMTDKKLLIEIEKLNTTVAKIYETIATSTENSLKALGYTDTTHLPNTLHFTTSAEDLLVKQTLYENEKAFFLQTENATEWNRRALFLVEEAKRKWLSFLLYYNSELKHSEALQKKQIDKLYKAYEEEIAYLAFRATLRMAVETDDAYPTDLNDTKNTLLIKAFKMIILLFYNRAFYEETKEDIWNEENEIFVAKALDQQGKKIVKKQQ